MSWFEQIDFSSIQDQLARSVEEASDLINTVNRLELLNLDELAKQQEEEERLEALEEEEEAEAEVEQNEERAGVDDWAGPQVSASASASSLRDVDVSVTYEEAAPAEQDADTSIAPLSSDPLVAAASGASAHWEVLSPPGKEARLVATRPEKPRQSSTATKNKKLKKGKKKKKKHLDFFGIRSNNDDDEDEDEEAKKQQQEQQQEEEESAQVPAEHAPEVGFDISALWDDAPRASSSAASSTLPSDRAKEHTAPSVLPSLVEDVEAGEPGPLPTRQKDVPSSSGAGASGTLGSASTFLTDLFTTATTSMQGKTSRASGTDAVHVVLRSQAVSFFDNVDAEVDLENDPILKKVEENKLSARTGGGSGAFNMVDYLSYFQTLIPVAPPSSSGVGGGGGGGGGGLTAKPASSLPSHVQLTGLSSAADGSAGMEALVDKLCSEWRVVFRQFGEQWTLLWQQLLAVVAATQGSVGSVLLATASVSYLAVQLAVCVLSFVLKASLALLLFVLEVLLLAVKRLFALRNDRLLLPCNVETFSNNRRWVREHLGAWAGRLQSQYLRANYIIGLTVALLLILSYWQFEGFLLSSDAATP